MNTVERKEKPKCIIILSHKSSGSTACQSFLSSFSNIHCIDKTRHYAKETLFWTKAASTLGLKQENMLDSEVPIPRRKAKHDLIELLTDNIDNYRPPHEDRDLIFKGWRELCYKYSPVYVEKSPHHLFQRPALELINECSIENTDIDFFIIGLIRNPMDTLYSAWSRRSTSPEKYQREWRVGYENLIAFKDSFNGPCITIRYEDMVNSVDVFEPVFQFAGINRDEIDKNFFHKGSISKWREDKYFGFNLDEDTIRVAHKFGYRKEELINDKSRYWTLNKYSKRIIYKCTAPGKTLLHKLRQQT